MRNFKFPLKIKKQVNNKQVFEYNHDQSSLFKSTEQKTNATKVDSNDYDNTHKGDWLKVSEFGPEDEY